MSEGGGGDLVTVLSLDDFEFRTGMRSAAAETKGLGDETLALSEKMEKAFHRPLHKGTHLAGSLAFMASGGKGIEDMAHKLERVTMLAPMIGAEFGPMGMAIGAVGGIIGAALVAKLEEAKERAREFGQELAKVAGEIDRIAAKEASAAKFSAELGRMNAGTSPEEIRGKLTGEQDEAAAIKAELRYRRRALHQQIMDATAAGGIESETPTFARFNPVTDELLAKITANPEVLGEAGAKAIEEGDRKIKELEDSLRRAENRAGALGEKLKDAESYESLLEEERELLRLEGEREKLAEKIGKEIETPYDKAKSKLDELIAARARDVIDQETFDKAAAKITADMGKEGHGPDQVNAGVAAGGGAAYAAIRDSIRSAERNDTPQLALLKEQITIARQQLAATQGMQAAIPQEVGLQ